MKLPTRFLLRASVAALLAGPAGAQVVPGGLGAIRPLSLPGPVAGPVLVPRIDLPAPSLGSGLPMLSLTPSLAAAPSFPSLPLPRIPSRPVVPVYRPSAARENVAHPLKPVLPGLRAQLDAPAKDRAGILFDGRRAPAAKPAVETGEFLTIPEADLEAEIGAAAQ
jgi:hypothetical protein